MRAFGESVVLGCWGLGGAPISAQHCKGYGEVSAAAADELLNSAWDRGVRWVDISLGYGAGTAAQRIAAWQGRTGNQFKIALKVGRPVVNGFAVPNYTLEGMLKEIAEAERSLGKASTILVKDPPFEVACRLEEVIAELKSNLGEVQMGFSSHLKSIYGAIDEGSGEPGGQVAEIEFNGANWRFCAGAIRALRARGWTTWGMQPLAYGFLTEKYSQEHQFPDRDWRSDVPAADRRVFFQLSRAFHSMFELKEVSPAVRALTFCLAQPCLDRVVVGPKSRSQLDDVERAWRLASDQAVRSQVAQIMAGG